MSKILQTQRTDMKKSKKSTFGFGKLTSAFSKSEKKKEFQIGDKSKEGCIDALYFMLTNFEGIENHSKGASFIQLQKYENKFIDYENTKHLRPEIIYYLTLCSVRELHDFYVDFYATFDKNKNFMLEPSEFTYMMNTVLDKCVGQKKFKVFTNICLIEPDLFDGKLDSKMMNEIIDNFRDTEGGGAIDYQLIFPYILSFFFEYTYQEIVFRKGRLDLVRGTEMIKGKEVEIKNIYSLSTILKEMGIDYIRDKYKYVLSYRDIENLILKFKNIQKWITFDIIKQILGQLAKLMKVDPQTGQEQKKMKLHKIINFLTLKLCIHQNCQYLNIRDKKQKLSQSAYLEVLILWNTAMYSDIMGKIQEKSMDQGEKSRIKHKKSLKREATENDKENQDQFRVNEMLQQYLQKKEEYTNQQAFSRVEALKILERFFKKYFQLMPRDQLGKIIAQHPKFKSKELIGQQITKEELVKEIYNMLCNHTHNKLLEYINLVLEGTTKRNQKLIDMYQNQGKVIDGFEDDYNSSNNDKSPDYKQSMMEGNDEIKSGSQSQEQEQEDEEKDKVEEESLKSQHSDQKNKTVKKFRRAVKLIQSEQAFVDNATTEKDYLKACLIMDSFLKRQVQEKEYQRKLKESRFQQQQEQALDDKNEQQQLQTSRKPSSNGDKNQTLTDQQMKKIEQNEQLKQEDEEHEIRQKEMELKKLQEQQDQKTQQAKISLVETIQKKQQSQKNDIKDKKDSFKELNIVLGKQQKDYGPSNYKNDKVEETNKGIQTNAKIMSFTIFSKQINQKEDFQVTIDEEELQLQLAVNQIKKKQQVKERDNCQCLIM